MKLDKNCGKNTSYSKKEQYVKAGKMLSHKPFDYKTVFINILASPYTYSICSLRISTSSGETTWCWSKK